MRKNPRDDPPNSPLAESFKIKFTSCLKKTSVRYSEMFVFFCINIDSPLEQLLSLYYEDHIQHIIKRMFWLPAQGINKIYNLSR